MISLISLSKAQQQIAAHLRSRRLAMDLTQQGLAQRSGVPLATLRKFEQQGIISLESLIKLLRIVGGLEEMIAALKPAEKQFHSIDQVLKEAQAPIRKRGSRK